MVRAIHICINYHIREEITNLNSSIQFFAPPWFPFDNFFSTSLNFFIKYSGNQIMVQLYTWRKKNIYLSWRLKDTNYIIVAELYAIYRCLLFKTKISSSDFLIFTDSLCSILLLSDQYGKSN